MLKRRMPEAYKAYTEDIILNNLTHTNKANQKEFPSRNTAFLWNSCINSYVYCFPRPLMGLWCILIAFYVG